MQADLVLAVPNSPPVFDQLGYEAIAALNRLEVAVMQQLSHNVVVQRRLSAFRQGKPRCATSCRRRAKEPVVARSLGEQAYGELVTDRSEEVLQPPFVVVQFRLAESMSLR